VAQAVEHLSSKCKTLSSNPRTERDRERESERERERKREKLKASKTGGSIFKQSTVFPWEPESFVSKRRKMTPKGLHIYTHNP
jgi:hypothetical protein